MIHISKDRSYVLLENEDNAFKAQIIRLGTQAWCGDYRSWNIYKTAYKCKRLLQEIGDEFIEIKQAPIHIAYIIL